MPEVIEAPVPEVIEQSTPPAPSAPRRFEIPSFTAPKEPAAAEPAPEAPKAESPPAPEVKPPDPEVEKRAQRQRQNRLYRQIAEEKARREFAEQELAKLRQSAAPVSVGGPDIANFASVDEYTKAVRAHERQETIKDYEQQRQIRDSDSRQWDLQQSWSAQLLKADEKYEDFEQVVGDLKPITPWAIAIMQAENAADVAYYLGKNLKEAQRIVMLDPIAQTREIGKIEAKLLATQPVPKPASKAPAPINPVTGAATVDSEIKPGMDFEKFRKLRNKQLGRT